MSKEIRTEQEFRAIVKTGKRLVLFYSGWCPYCQAFLPVFETHCKGVSGDYCRVAVDDELESLEDEYGVDVVPTVICFENGAITDRLDGVPGRGLTEKQLVDFMGTCGVKK